MFFRCNGTEWRSPAQVKKLVLLILLEIILKEFAVSVSSKRSYTKVMSFSKKSSIEDGFVVYSYLFVIPHYMLPFFFSIITVSEF